MPFTVQNTDWNALARIEAPKRSANPVMKLVGNANETLWLKRAPGLARAGFASTVLGRAGFQSSDRTIPANSQEAGVILNKLRPLANTPVLQQRLQDFEEPDRAAQDFLLMDSVPGVDYTDHLPQQPDRAFAEHLRLLNQSSIRSDLARLIAADMLLGNFDRLAYNSFDKEGKWRAKFHGGNFKIEELAAGARFLPIDNDTVSPSVEHLNAPEGRAATTEDLYATVIRGGCLNPGTTGAFPAAEQSSMNELLGPNAIDAIYLIIGKYFLADLDRPENAGDKAEVRIFAVMIAAEVKVQMRNMLDELRDNQGRQGLNRLMKAYNNMEGMNYDAFKVKSRFADLMVNVQNMDVGEAQKRAMAYGKYRDWKASMTRLLAPVPNYTIPSVAGTKLDLKQAAARKLGNVFTAVKESPKSGPTEVGLSHDIKKLVRSGRFTEAELRAEYAKLVNLPDSDRAAVKAKLLCIAELLQFDIVARSVLLEDVLKSVVPGEWVAKFYCKAIYKRRITLQGIVAEFGQKQEVIRSRLLKIGEKPPAEKLWLAFSGLRNLSEQLLVTAERINRDQAQHV
jgi:hypothetical protein